MTGSLSSVEAGRYRQRGWVAPWHALSEVLRAPVRGVVARLAAQPPRQDLLVGIHNPFGRHACVDDAWKFLDIGESAEVLDLVEALIGPDLVLWDSELLLDPLPLSADEARYWPVNPLAGVLLSVAIADGGMLLADITRLAAIAAQLPSQPGARYLLRYMPATSHYERDPRAAAHRLAAETRPLVNHANRPIWLVRGEDRAGSDFAAGFSPPAARWAGGLPARL